MKKQDGGPAFSRPCGYYHDMGTVYVNDAQRGMSLRDYFASQVLSAMAASFAYSGPEVPIELSKRAYLFADAMIKERSANNG